MFFICSEQAKTSPHQNAGSCRVLPGAAGVAAMSPTVSRLMQASHDR
jgi:hypothetical protein